MNEQGRHEIEQNLTHFHAEAQRLLEAATDALAYFRQHDPHAACNTIGLAHNHLSGLHSQRDWLLQLFKHQGVTPGMGLTG